jgi:hypothetical protein
MIVPSPLPVALLPPAANIAMADWLGIGIARIRCYSFVECALDDTVIGRKGRHPVGFRFEPDMGPDDVEEIRFHALKLPKEFGIKAQLEDGFCLGFTCELAIDDFVGPVAHAAPLLGLFDSEKHIGAASPYSAHQVGLKNDGHACLHCRPGCLVRRFLRFLGKIGDCQAVRVKMFDVCGLVVKAALPEDNEVRIVPGWLRNFALGKTKTQSREVSA